MARALATTPPPGAAAQPARLLGLSLLVVGSAVLAPVWASPVVVTTDGPSHLYNAMVADAIRTGRSPYAVHMRLTHRGLGPNRLSAFLLETLGRRVGWEVAERILVSLIMAATFGLLALLLSHVGFLAATALLPVAAWLAHSWFVWMGFYDFALSTAGYVGLLLVLGRRQGLVRDVLLLAALGFLYAVHFLTFAVGTGLAVAVTVWNAWQRRERWTGLIVVGPAALLAVIELATGGAGGGGVGWESPLKAVAGLTFGDFVRSFHPTDAIGGSAIMGAAAASLVLRRRSLGALDAFGALLLALSLVAPANVGSGGYVPIRLQMLGVVTLLPAIATTVARLPARWPSIGAAVVFVAFLAHAAYVVRVSSQVRRDLVVLERLLAADGASDGDWVRTRFVNVRRGLFRISAYRHLVDRIALRQRLLVLDDYEALYGVFAIAWRERPDWLTFRPAGRGLALELVPGDVRWTPLVHVVHEREWPLATADARLTLGPTLAADAFAVTPVRRRS